MTTRRVLLILGMICLVVAAMPTYWLWTQKRPYERHAIADSSWRSGGGQYSVMFTILDSNGTPLPGISVGVDDPSGGRGGVTDENGVCDLSTDGAFMSFSLNGVQVMDERDSLFGPNPGGTGLLVKVVVKDLAAIGLGAR